MSLAKIKNLWHMDKRFKWRVLRVKNDEGFPVPKTNTVAYACYADYGKQAHLLKLGCLKAVRGLGLGRWLLLQVLNEMTATGVREVMLEVRKSNAVARHLYCCHGFQEDGIQPMGYPRQRGRSLDVHSSAARAFSVAGPRPTDHECTCCTNSGIYVLEDLHAEMDRQLAMAAVEAEVKVCVACGLCKGRNNAVPGEGDPNSVIMFVGEGPGRDEDLQGRPFVGRSGQLLTRMLQEVGIDRESVFIYQCGEVPPARKSRSFARGN